jgi:uncharacterized protein (TIRG00374 family)
MTGSQKSSSRPWAKHLIGLLITMLCLVVLFRQINLHDVLDALTRFNWWYLIFGIASLSFGYAMRILRWSMMLRAIGAATSFAGCSAPFLGSIALNNILPLRLGDVVRVLVFPCSMGITRVTATSSLIMERLIDLMSLLSCFAIGLFAIQAITIPAELKSTAVTLSVFGAITLIIGFLYSAKLARLFNGFAEKAGSKVKMAVIYIAVRGLLEGFNSMSRPKSLFGILIISMLVWIGEAGLFYFVLLGTGFQSSPIMALLVMAVATLSTLVPSSPGYVGPFHLAAFTAVSLIGGTASQAASYAVIVHLALWVPTTIGGVIAICTSPELFKMAKAHAA